MQQPDIIYFTLNVYEKVALAFTVILTFKTTNKQYQITLDATYPSSPRSFPARECAFKVIDIRSAHARSECECAFKVIRYSQRACAPPTWMSMKLIDIRNANVNVHSRSSIFAVRMRAANVNVDETDRYSERMWMCIQGHRYWQCACAPRISMKMIDIRDESEYRWKWSIFGTNLNVNLNVNMMQLYAYLKKQLANFV